MNEHNLIEQVEELGKVIDELIELNKKIPIIVEGDKDIIALKALSVCGDIFKVNTGRSILNTCEMIAHRTNEVIILTDWDKKGGSIARKLADSFESCSVRVNLDLRAKLAILCKKDIKDIESLYRYISNLNMKLLQNTAIKDNIAKASNIKLADSKRNKR